MADTSGIDPTGLELHLEFDGDYDDESPNNRDQLPEIGADAYASDGAVGQAAKFRYASQNHIDTGVNALGNADMFCDGASSDFTFSTFVRFKEDSVYGAGTIISRQEGTGTFGISHSNLFIHVTSDRRLLVRLRGADNYYVPVMHDGAFHHVGLTWDGTSAIAYFDGQPLGTCIVGNVPENTTNIFIGGSYLPDITGLPTSNLVGQLDDLRVYSRAWSAAEMLRHYHYGPGTDDILQAESLELLLRFEDDYLDSSGNARHQTANVEGNPTFVSGKVNEKGLRFDGTGDAIPTGASALGDATLYHGSGDTWSAMAWIRLNGGDAGGDFISRERNSPNVGGFRMVANANSYDIYLGGTQNNYVQASTDDGEWHHIAVTFDDGATPKAKVYYDGVAESDPSLGAEADGTVDIVIGARRGTGADPGSVIGNYDGDLDDVRIYSRTLTAADIDEIFNEDTRFEALLTIVSIAGGVASMRVVFARSVTGFTAGDVTVTNGTASNAAGSGTTWTFDVTPTASGTVSAFVNAGGVVDSGGEVNSQSNTVSYGIGGIAGGGNGLSRFDRATSPTHTASVLIGPIAIAPNSCERSIVSQCRAIFGSGTTATGSFKVSVGLDGEDAITRAVAGAHQYTATLTTLDNNHGLCYPRVGGSAAVFQIDVTTGHLSLENIDVFLENAGRNVAARYTP